MLRPVIAGDTVDGGSGCDERERADEHDQPAVCAGPPSRQFDRRQDCPERKSLSAARPRHERLRCGTRTSTAQVREEFFGGRGGDPASG
jgi:hypothetical protein